MIRVGVFFGGSSREREVSFAGGRTVYDNLDKRMFQAIPIFVDSAGNFVELDWEYIYRGTIRDFFPPAAYLKNLESPYQIYSESLQLSAEEYRKMLESVGRPLRAEELAGHIDFAFLALHGSRGEDGTIQGLLEWYGIPYSGSGVLASALGVSKFVQKKWWDPSLPLKAWRSIRLDRWEKANRTQMLEQLVGELGLPFVVKSANQGSSIGVQVISDRDVERFGAKVDHCFFKVLLSKEEWERRGGVAYIQNLIDLRTGLGLPVLCNGEAIADPHVLHERISSLLEEADSVALQAAQGEHQVVFEPFLKGREFSCIVIVDEAGNPFALPPTEVVKGQEIFDYNSKYLPGLSHKQTPIRIADERIQEIRGRCEELFTHFGFEVYARIDGFITDEGVYLNDPNTTSGMMPSSFFFHQAAEIGMGPKEFITYIIRTSLAERLRTQPVQARWSALLHQIDTALEAEQTQLDRRKKVAVILGGYSTERHISVESGRNIYEKLASSVDFEPTPIFLSGADGAHELYEIPINILLKDNADDIRDKVHGEDKGGIIETIRQDARDLTAKYARTHRGYSAVPLSYDQLAERFDDVFIALHGRPGEDGQVQEQLDLRGMPYNGSGVQSSRETINKHLTNQKLRAAGFLVADSLLVNKAEWQADMDKCMGEVREKIGFPLIAKPHDEGCSSAVLKIEGEAQLLAYAQLCFGLRERDEALEAILGLGPKEEFPQKEFFLVETFTSRGDARHFLEITGGMLGKWENGQLAFEVFEPSEALSSGTVLSLAEKFLAGEGQNITPARFSADPIEQRSISREVRKVLEGAARTMGVEGYCRIDAFVRIYDERPPEVILIEINSLPGMTPATCIYHQAALNHYKPFEFIKAIMEFGEQRLAQ